LQIDSSNVSRLASQLTTLTQAGLIKPEKIDALQQNLNSSEQLMYFSKRETEVLSYVVKGYTARKISLILKLSMRTIEHHIENIKLKSGCTRKYELIYKFANKFSGIQS
jgi:DNA-binding NarL/FixJ family response regulator